MTLEPKQTGQTLATPPCQPEQGTGTHNSSSMVLAPKRCSARGQGHLDVDGENASLTERASEAWSAGGEEAGGGTPV